MVATIVLNGSNLINSGSGNNTFVYNFPNSVSFPHHEIAVQSVSMYYSWANINDTSLSNNRFTYTWETGGTTTTYNVVIPVGLYEIVDINSYLQFVFIQNGHYLINPAGQNVYYAEMIVNPNLYAVQVNTFPIPTTLPSGWTSPVGFGGFPSVAFQTTLTFPANFNKIVGFSAGFATAGNSNPSSNYSVTSTISPQVQPNANVYIGVSNISNPYAVPNSIIYAISPNVAFGSQIKETPPQFAWNKLLNGTYTQIRLQILGSDLSPLPILDPNMTIILCIRNTKESIDTLTQALEGGK
jgi:hypothetical protein